MADPFRKVRTGDPLRIPAVAYNAFIDAAHLARRIGADAQVDASLAFSQEHLVRVRNESGEDLPRFGILGIVGSIIEPGEGGNPDEFKRRAALIGAAITLTDEYIGRFVVAREPIPNGRIGWAVIRGVTPAMINVISDEHTHADTFPDEQHLRVPGTNTYLADGVWTHNDAADGTPPQVTQFSGSGSESGSGSSGSKSSGSSFSGSASLSIVQTFGNF